MTGTQFFDERDRVDRGEWTLEFREPEYTSFQLIMHDVHSSLAHQILDERQSSWRHAQEAYELALRRIYSTYRRFCTKFRGMTNSVHVDLTARSLGLTTRDVYAALRDAELFRIDGLMSEVA